MSYTNWDKSSLIKEVIRLKREKLTVICEQERLHEKIQNNHKDAEIIIAAREFTIDNYRNGINDILDAVRRTDEDIEAKAWNWLIDRLIDIK